MFGTRRLFALTALLLAAANAQGHSGGLNSEGCHNNRKTGEYHCHRNPAPERDAGTVKLSRSGICHGPNSPWYAQTQHFVAYRSIEECLAAGGRLPKG